MQWQAAPGYDPEYLDLLPSLGLVDDAQPFEVEVTELDLSKPGYTLSVTFAGDEIAGAEEPAGEEEIASFGGTTDSPLEVSGFTPVKSKGYSDVTIDGLSGESEIVALDKNTFFVSGWNGLIWRIDLSRGAITESPPATTAKGMAGGTLGSLCVNRSQNLAAAATGAPWAVVWHQDSGKLDKVYAASGQRVNAVTFSPTGGYLVLGTGNYSLSTAGQFEARIEIWSYDSEWQLELFAALPGSNGDWLGWHEDSNAILAVSGRETQDGGHTSFLEGSTLRSLRICEHDSFGSYVCGMQDYPFGVVTYGTALRMIPLDGSIKTYRRVKQDLNLTGSFLCDGEIVTVSGHLLDPETGQTRSDLKPLDKCCRVAPRPGGGYIGISSSGVLRVWEAV